MRYEDKADNCQWCKKEMDSGVNGERPKLFCSDACRYKYHNAQKKLKREIDKAFWAVNYIQSMMLKSGELQIESTKMIRQLIAHTQQISFECVCRECGQYRMLIPLAGDKCDFCQAENWRFFEKKQLNLSKEQN